MRFYTKQHRYSCGIDLHARTMYVCILNHDGAMVFLRNLPSTPAAFLRAIAAYRDDLVVAVECMFAWYWLADLCAREQIPFVLGHALYMKAIPRGQGEERQDRLSNQPTRPARALSRSQCAEVHLRSVAGIGKILALVMLYEIHDIDRFPTVQDFASYARLVKCPKESAGKRHGSGGAKSGNAKALSILTHKLGRAVYYMLKRQEVFDSKGHSMWPRPRIWSWDHSGQPPALDCMAVLLPFEKSRCR